jgi:nitroimidazol reductase NimA-like FMN-containing flavoprotein (pyridoxamine 5'-phosphate oxidase superfamily)
METREIIELLKGIEFVHVSTCDERGRPNAAPKFLLKVEGNFIYLVDYTIGRTWRNLKKNPRISFSFLDEGTLVGYQINGRAQIVDCGPLYGQLCDEMKERKIRLSVEHLIREVRGGKRRENFEVSIANKFVIFKVEPEEIVELGIRGELRRKRIEGVSREDPGVRDD